MPELAAAFTAAAVSEDHVDAVATARRRIDRSVRQAFDSLDGDITAYAKAHTPDQLVEHLRFVQRRLERQLSRDLDLRRRRAVRVRKWIDKAGDYQLHGSFDPEMGARIFGAIDTAVDTLRAGNPASLVPGDDPDDALASDREFLAAHALARLVTDGHMAMHPGVAEVVVLVDEHSLLFGQHDDTVCELHDGTPVDIDTVRRLCCEAMLRAVVVTADGTIPLNVGRAQRTATREQRRALRAIHRTCAIDGCTTPFDWCEIHHIWFWELDGLTDLDNLVPLVPPPPPPRPRRRLAAHARPTRPHARHSLGPTAPSTVRHDHPDSGRPSSDLPTLTVPPHRAGDEPTRAQPPREPHDGSRTRTNRLTRAEGSASDEAHEAHEA
ncbi:MAG: hypothetical protein WKF58_08120 [Ilumatobacteraceae bacterium]